MIDPLLLPELQQMLSENDTPGMKEFCDVLHSAAAAEILEALSDDEIWQVLSYTNLPRQVEIFEYFPLSRQRDLIGKLDSPRLVDLLEQMASDDRADLLESLEPELLEAVLPQLAQADRNNIRRLMSYPEGTAGSIMTTDYASLPEDISVGEALTQLRLQAPDRETIYYVYVLDDDRRLLGFVSLRKLILAKLETPLANIMDRDVISVRADEDQEDAARTLARYDFIAMPVVDDQNRLVGIITHDDVFDVMQEEMTEDVLRMGAVGPMTENYLEASFVSVWRQRAMWLSCLFVAELFTFTALANYADMIDQLVILSLMMPLCISTGGNSGSQAATLITRALALGQLNIRDWWRVLRHEVLMGLALGSTLGIIGFVRAAITPQYLLGAADRWLLALVVSQSVAAIVLWGTLIGALLPLLFKRLGIDPGIASSPFVATFVDVTGIIIYFNMARLYLL
jgi:magnesium transporter